MLIKMFIIKPNSLKCYRNYVKETHICILRKCILSLAATTVIGPEECEKNSETQFNGK